MKWISVYERLPAPGVPVLVAYESGMMRVSYVIRTADLTLQFKDQSRASIVSHWMPLPSQPQRGNPDISAEEAGRLIGNGKVNRSGLIAALRITEDEK